MSTAHPTVIPLVQITNYPADIRKAINSLDPGRNVYRIRFRRGTTVDFKKHQRLFSQFLVALRKQEGLLLVSNTGKCGHLEFP